MTTLYTVPTANGQRASIALEECGIDYEAQTVDLVSGEHRSEEMLALNPFGRMPVLKTDDENMINAEVMPMTSIAPPNFIMFDTAVSTLQSTVKAEAATSLRLMLIFKLLHSVQIPAVQVQLRVFCIPTCSQLVTFLEMPLISTI